jgi:nickel-dependent lactate racemase
MNVHLPFGADTVPVDVPDNWINGRCYRAFRFDPAHDERAEIQAAFNEPVGMESVAATVRGKARRHGVLVIDTSAPALLQTFLPALLDELLEASGLKANHLTLLVANSAWQSVTSDDVEALLPPELRKRHPVELHDPFDAGKSRKVGAVLGGIDVFLNKTYLDADLRILCGPVAPDMIHGFRGGRSLVLPGLAAEQTLRQLYSFDHVAQPAVTYGGIQNNPFHAAGMQALMLAGCDLVVAPILAPNGRLSQLVIGDPGQAFLAAVNRVTEKMSVTLKEPMDIVVTCGGGAPFDSTLAQVVNALAAVEPVLKPDGTILLSAELSGGFGPDPLRRLLLEAQSPAGFRKRFAESGSFVPGQWVAQRLFRILDAHEIILYTRGLSDDEVWAAGLTPIDRAQDAIEVAMQEHGQRCKICALPDGPFSLASLPARPR